MLKQTLITVAIFYTFILLSSCENHQELVKASCGERDYKCAKAGPASVISMGRDDDDGKAKKWHIGGSKRSG